LRTALTSGRQAWLQSAAPEISVAATHGPGSAITRVARRLL
jgi:hypothetical protein